MRRFLLVGALCAILGLTAAACKRPVAAPAPAPPPPPAAPPPPPPPPPKPPNPPCCCRPRPTWIWPWIWIWNGFRNACVFEPDWPKRSFTS